MSISTGLREHANIGSRLLCLIVEQLYDELPSV